tara:strand:+ start:879 stop:1028 length:150 start_codon:yes stop_codon:yes gene_type:complete
MKKSRSRDKEEDFKKEQKNNQRPNTKCQSKKRKRFCVIIAEAKNRAREV